MKRHIAFSVIAVMVGIVLLSYVPLIISCSNPNVYETNIIVETEISALAEQYELWYQAAPYETQQEWKEKIDPLFLKADELLDIYHDALKVGSDTNAVAVDIMKLKSDILMMLAKHGLEE